MTAIKRRKRMEIRNIAYCDTDLHRRNEHGELVPRIWRHVETEMEIIDNIFDVDGISPIPVGVHKDKNGFFVASELWSGHKLAMEKTRKFLMHSIRARIDAFRCGDYKEKTVHAVAERTLRQMKEDGFIYQSKPATKIAYLHNIKPKGV